MFKQKNRVFRPPQQVDCLSLSVFPLNFTLLKHIQNYVKNITSLNHCTKWPRGWSALLPIKRLWVSGSNGHTWRFLWILIFFTCNVLSVCIISWHIEYLNCMHILILRRSMTNKIIFATFDYINSSNRAQRHWIIYITIYLK